MEIHPCFNRGGTELRVSWCCRWVQLPNDIIQETEKDTEQYPHYKKIATCNSNSLRKTKKHPQRGLRGYRRRFTVRFLRCVALLNISMRCCLFSLLINTNYITQQSTNILLTLDCWHLPWYTNQVSTNTWATCWPTCGQVSVYMSTNVSADQSKGRLTVDRCVGRNVGQVLAASVNRYST